MILIILFVADYSGRAFLEIEGKVTKTTQIKLTTYKDCTDNAIHKVEGWRQAGRGGRERERERESGTDSFSFFLLPSLHIAALVPTVHGAHSTVTNSTNSTTDNATSNGTDTWYHTGNGTTSGSAGNTALNARLDTTGHGSNDLHSVPAADITLLVNLSQLIENVNHGHNLLVAGAVISSVIAGH